MDFSPFGPLLDLREELAAATDPGTPHDAKAIALIKRAGQLRERTLMILAKAAPAVEIEEIFRAAAAPLPELPVEPATLVPPKARRARKPATPATTKTPKKAKKAKNVKKAQP